MPQLDERAEISHRQIVDLINARIDQVHQDQRRDLREVRDRVDSVAKSIAPLTEETARQSVRLQHIEREQSAAHLQRSKLGERIDDSHRSLKGRIQALEIPVTGAKAIFWFIALVGGGIASVAGIGYSIVSIIQKFR